MVLNFADWKTVDFGEVNNFIRSGLHDPTNAVSHPHLLPRKCTCLVTPGIGCFMTEGRLVHSLSKCLQGTHVRKQIWSLIGSCPQPPHRPPPTPAVLGTSDPLTLLCYLPSHTQYFPSLAVPLPTLVPSSAWWDPICLWEPQAPSQSLPFWALPAPQPVLGTISVMASATFCHPFLLVSLEALHFSRENSISFFKLRNNTHTIMYTCHKLHIQLKYFLHIYTCIICMVLMCISLMNNISVPPKSSCFPLPSQYLPAPPEQITILISNTITLIWSVLKLQLSGITQ